MSRVQRGVQRWFCFRFSFIPPVRLSQSLRLETNTWIVCREPSFQEQEEELDASFTFRLHFSFYWCYSALEMGPLLSVRGTTPKVTLT